MHLCLESFGVSSVSVKGEVSLGISNFVLPSVFLFICVYAVLHGVDIFGAFITGAKNGLTTVISILPPLVGLVTLIGMLNASGAMEVLCHALTPLGTLLGLPTEVLPLAVARPLSGSMATAVFNDIIAQYGSDSYVGLVASVMMGSTETTLYTLTVYMGAARVKHTRYALTAALLADIAGFFFAALAVGVLLL